MKAYGEKKKSTGKNVEGFESCAVYTVTLSITANRTCRFSQAAKIACAWLSLHNPMHIYRLCSSKVDL